MKDPAIRPGELHHALYFSRTHPAECVIIETWESADQCYAFLASDRFKPMANFFDGELDIEELEDPDWNKW
jgi:quinol monooxygenase YgiN